MSDEQAQRERDEFERIQLTAQMEKDRAILAQYAEGMAYHQARVEDTRYELGRLDERLNR